MLEPGERKKAHRLVARTINEAGGILGRRVVPLFFEFSSTDYSTYEELWRSACSYFTEEHEVLAILGVRGSETLAPCMEAADAIHVVPPMKDVDLETYRRYPHSIGPTNMSLDRIAEHYVQALDAQGFFESGDRVGLVSWDTPMHDRVIERVLMPALGRVGVRLTLMAQVEPPTSEADQARAVADAESVVVQFKQEDINKVMLLGSYGSRNVFMKLAESHQYRPTYGLYSHNGGVGPTAIEEQQLRGAVGVGWLPTADVSVKRGLQLSPAARRCRALMRAGGLEVYESDDNAIATNEICDFWLFMKAAVEAGAPAITADSVIAGAETMGDAFEPGAGVRHAARQRAPRRRRRDALLPLFRRLRVLPLHDAALPRAVIGESL